MAYRSPMSSDWGLNPDYVDEVDAFLHEMCREDPLIATPTVVLFGALKDCHPKTRITPELFGKCIKHLGYNTARLRFKDVRVYAYRGLVLKSGE